MAEVVEGLSERSPCKAFSGWKRRVDSEGTAAIRVGRRGGELRPEKERRGRERKGLPTERNTTPGMRFLAGMLLGVAGIGSVCAEDAQKPAYLNPSLPAEQRAADLVQG